MAPSPESWGLRLRRLSEPRLWVLAIVVILTIGESAFAQLPSTSVTTLALGGALRLDSPALLDCHHNPALVDSNHYRLEFTASRLFEMSDFDIGAGAISYSYRRINITAAMASLLGADYYSERSLLIALSISPVRRFRFGAGLEQRHLDFGEGYAGASLYAFSLGSVLALRDNLHVAAAALDLNRPRYCETDPKSPLRIEFAATYTASLISIVLAHHLDSQLPDRFSLGQVYKITGDFELLLGIESEPLELSGGFSFKLRGFNFEYGYRNNVYLGGTHRVGLRYSR